MSHDRHPTNGDARADGGSTEESAHSAAASDETDRDAEPESDRGQDHGDVSQTDANGGEADRDSNRDPDRDPDRGPEADRRAPGGGPSDNVALAISLLFGLALAVGSVLLVGWLDPAFEGLLRVRPTVPGGGVAADWVAGNADPVLNLLIVLVHLADVVMGIFILVLVFVHWAAFRRLAARMQPPGGRGREDRAATDGGNRDRSLRDPPRQDADGTGDADGGDRR